MRESACVASSFEVVAVTQRQKENLRFVVERCRDWTGGRSWRAVSRLNCAKVMR
jgi:hypothetical protein